MTIFLLLSSLHPGNYLHGQKQPDTLSFYLPNILVTAIESKTPGTVSLLSAKRAGQKWSANGQKATNQ